MWNVPDQKAFAVNQCWILWSVVSVIHISDPSTQSLPEAVGSGRNLAVAIVTCYLDRVWGLAGGVRGCPGCTDKGGGRTIGAVCFACSCFIYSSSSCNFSHDNPFKEEEANCLESLPSTRQTTDGLYRTRSLNPLHPPLS